MKSASAAVRIIGVGNMGGGMVSNLLARGWRVQVHDIDPEKIDFYKQKGAQSFIKYAQTAPENIATLASQPAVTIVCVVDAAQTEHVLWGRAHDTTHDTAQPGGLAECVGAGHTVMLCPTIAPDDVERFAAGLARRGIHTIDAPMSGGPARAADGSMSLMLACSDALLAQHATLIHALSAKVFHISQRVGDAARTKLVNNLLAGINLVGAAEALALAERMGLDLTKTLDVIEQSSGQSWIGSDRMRRALAQDYVPRAHTTLLAKDTALAIRAAQALQFTGPLGQHASAVFHQAVGQGMAELDDAAVFELLRGLQLRHSKLVGKSLPK